MTALILHPNDELFYVDLQKKIIDVLFSEERILYQKLPLWIEFDNFDLKDKSQIKKVSIGELCTCEDSVYCQVFINCGQRKIESKLTLVCLYKGKSFTDSEIAGLKEKPARQIKVFRLGIEKELSSNSKCITESKWVKVR